MKFTLVLIVVVAVVARVLSCTDESWNEFKATHDKTYKNGEEEARRREIFCENVDYINDHNEMYERGEVTYKKGINQFTDWSQEEFAAWVGKRGARKKQIE